MARVLGIDHGKKRLGLALSDPERSLALSLEVVDGGDRHRLLSRLHQVVLEHEVDTVVLGHPLSLAGESGPQARRVEEFAERLRFRLGRSVEVVLWDERLSSQQVDRVAPSSRKATVGRDGTRDLMAAVVILQSYLDFRRG